MRMRNGVLIDEYEVIDPPTAQELADAFVVYKNSALLKIDTDAENERLKYITAGDGQMASYQKKEQEAADVVAKYANGTFTLDPVVAPDPANYLWLSTELGILSPSIKGVAESIDATAGIWRNTVGPSIERTRRLAKQAVEGAIDEAAVDAALVIDWTIS